MASWVYADDCDVNALQCEVDRLSMEKKRNAQAQEEKKTVWTLLVEYTGNLRCNEYVAVTGNCPSLGNWMPNDLLIMRRAGDNKHTVDVRVTRGFDVLYRYVVCSWNALNDSYTLVKWETHLNPRSMRDRKKKLERFGWQLSDYKVSAPWVRNGETFVHFHIFHAPFYWPQGLKQNLVMYVKLIPICATEISEFIADETSGKEAASPKTEFVRVNVKNLSLMRNEVFDQQEYGARCGSKDLVVFDMTVSDTSLTLYRFDVYTCGTCDMTMAKYPPCFYGYGYVEPQELRQSDGCIKLRINAPDSNKLRCIIKLKYQLILPYTGKDFTLERTYQSYWHDKKVGLLVGHRGCGKSYQHGEDFVRENTIFSFNRAGKYGANMVELDVMLTRDAKPMVYHDQVLFKLTKPEPFTDSLKEREVIVLPSEHFNEQELLTRAGRIENGIMIFAFEAFTAEELQRCKVYRFCTPERKITCGQMLHEQMPFALLEHVLAEVDANLGFVIEVKYTQKDNQQEWEFFGFKPTFERNQYVDKILEVVLQHAGQRRIVFTSFDCATCLCLRYKQNLYPVLLLQRDPFTEIQYADSRVNEFQNAVFTSKAMDLSGLVLHTHTILNDPQTVKCVKGLGMLALCWGAANNDADNRERLQRFGVHGIIFDGVDQADAVVTKPTLLKLETIENKDYLACVQKVELKKKCVP